MCSAHDQEVELTELMVFASAVLAVITELPVSITAWNARIGTSEPFTSTELFKGTTQCLCHRNQLQQLMS